MCGFLLADEPGRGHLGKEDPVSDSPPAGWYPDPQNDGQQRWWDGSGWTEHVAPRTAPPSGGPSWPSTPSGLPPQGQAPGYGQYGGYGEAPGGVPGMTQQWRQVNPMLWQSIVYTFLCCVPAGILAIVFASQANTANQRGDWVTAAAKAKQAKVTMVVGAVLVAAFVVVLVAAGGDFERSFGR